MLGNGPANFLPNVTKTFQIYRDVASDITDEGSTGP